MGCTHFQTVVTDFNQCQQILKIPNAAKRTQRSLAAHFGNTSLFEATLQTDQTFPRMTAMSAKRNETSSFQKKDF